MTKPSERTIGSDASTVPDGYGDAAPVLEPARSSAGAPAERREVLDGYGITSRARLLDCLNLQLQYGGNCRTPPLRTTTTQYGPEGWGQNEFNKGHTEILEKTPCLNSQTLCMTTSLIRFVLNAGPRACRGGSRGCRLLPSLDGSGGANEHL